MDNLKAKLKKQGGFTLIEMLIVVAIIAILIAISIPMVNAALERARESTDDANYRSAVALGYIEFMTKEDADMTGNYYYVIGAGTDNKVGGTLLKAGTTLPSGAKYYVSKCRGSSANDHNTATGSHKDQMIKVWYDKGEVYATWVPKAES